MDRRNRWCRDNIMHLENHIHYGAIPESEHGCGSGERRVPFAPRAGRRVGRAAVAAAIVGSLCLLGLAASMRGSEGAVELYYRSISDPGEICMYSRIPSFLPLCLLECFQAVLASLQNCHCYTFTNNSEKACLNISCCWRILPTALTSVIKKKLGSECTSEAGTPLEIT